MYLFFDIMDMVRDMGLFFKKKQALSSVVMAKLIHETVCVRTSEIEPILDEAGAIYDPLENQLVVMAINYEIMGWKLKKGNPKDKVDNILKMSYESFFRSLQIEPIKVAEYRNLMNQAKEKADEILFARFQKVSKSVLIYKLILELEKIKEDVLDLPFQKNLELLVNGWFQIAKSIGDEYKISDNEQDLQQNKPIDFDF